MIIDHTYVVEALLSKHLIPEIDQHNMLGAPEAKNVVWYDFVAPEVVEIYTGPNELWTTLAARSHDEIESLMRKIGRVPVRIGDPVPDIDRDIKMWIAVPTDVATIAMLEGYREPYVVYQGAIWWGFCSDKLLTDPVYVWLVDRQIQTIKGVA